MQCTRQRYYLGRHVVAGDQTQETREVRVETLYSQQVENKILKIEDLETSRKIDNVVSGMPCSVLTVFEIL